ncbi:MAG TPA: RIP metalloprotease RseP [Candidatus Sulfotelmatobacter sp.]|nr:RIP metalloprotease RseP [Candidatus Sulfotelmatobacter sp.]
MSDFLISLVSVAAVLGFMILIHEFGHYAVAKWLGVRVEQFAIGFGKRLVGFRKGDTDYRINAIPLGGYVKMSGENPMDQRTDDPKEFLNHSRWHRFLIAIAGPAMNILLAVVLLTVVYMVHYEYPVYLDKPAVVQGVRKDSPAAQAGIQAGDRIVKIDGVDNPTWEQVQPKVWLSPNQPLEVTIQRGNQTLQKTLMPKAVTSSEVGSAGWFPEEPVVVGRLDPGLPAAKAGMKEDDRIVSLNGKAVPSIESMIDSLQQTKSQSVNLEVERGGQILSFQLTPVLSPTEDPKEQRYRLGFVNKGVTKVSQLPFAQALSLSLEQNKKYSYLILELAKKMVQRKISMRAISGPIGIAQDAGYAAQQKGWTPLMELTAGISLNLGIFNLLPIPILDGGVILFLLIEGLMRRDISMTIKERVYQAAFVFLVLFAVMVIYNDLMKTIPGLADRLP